MRRREIPALIAATPEALARDLASIDSTAGADESERRTSIGFHGYVVDRCRWTLSWQNEPLAVSRKSFDLILYMIDHRDRVLSKNELLKALWPKQVVEESNLSQHVFLLRKALSRHPSAAKIIETVPGRGYRFVAELDAAAPPPATLVTLVCEEPERGVSLAPWAAQPSRVTATQRSWRTAVPLVVAIFALGVSAGYFLQTGSPRASSNVTMSQSNNVKLMLATRGGPGALLASGADRCAMPSRGGASCALLAQDLR